MPVSPEEPLHVRRSLTLTFREKYVRPWLTPLIALLAAVTFVAGSRGYIIQYYDNPNDRNPDSWTVPFFKTMQLYLLNSGAEDDKQHPTNDWLFAARISAALLFVVISLTVISWVLEEIRHLPRLMWQKHHTIVCGLGQIGLQVLDGLYTKNRAHDAVVIEADPENPWIQYARGLGADVIIGDATRGDILRKAHAEQAKAVFVVTGDDGVNVESAAEVADIVGKYRKPSADKLALYVHIVDINFSVALQPLAQTLDNADRLEVRVFNVPRTAAGMLVTNQLWPFAPKTPKGVAHFIILGFGAMGQALAVQLAQLAHFPNLKRSRFTIVDRDIDKSASEFLSRFPRFCPWSEAGRGVAAFSPQTDEWSDSSQHLPDGIRVLHEPAIQYVSTAQFLELPPTIGDELFAIRIKNMLDEPGVKPIIFVCGQEDHDNFDSAVRLREKLRCQKAGDVPIFVWLPKQPALAVALAKVPEHRFMPFGECRQAASLEEIENSIREELGRAFHEDYEHRHPKPGMPPKPWKDESEEFRESNRQAADHTPIKLKLLEYALYRLGKGDVRSSIPKELYEKNKEVLARMEHYRWVAERLMTGWRFEPEASADKNLKLNSNLVPWEQLTERAKEIDFEQLDAFLRECEENPSFTVKPTDKEAATRNIASENLDRLA